MRQCSSTMIKLEKALRAAVHKGVKFIINNDRAGSYGGYDGKLYYNANKGIYPVTTGTYDISVDLINGTYTIQSIN